MAIFEYCVRQVKNYFFYTNLLHITIITIIIIYSIFLFIDAFLHGGSFLFIYWNFIYSFLIYFSILFLVKKYLYVLSKKKYININKVFKIMMLLFFIKFLWNALYIIIFDLNFFSANIYKTFYPIILFFFSWMYIYFAASYYISYIYFEYNRKIRFNKYIILYWHYLVLNIIISCLVSFFIVYFITYVLNYVSYYISCLKWVCVHKNVEVLINIILKLFFSHMISIMSINTYYMICHQKCIK